MTVKQPDEAVTNNFHDRVVDSFRKTLAEAYRKAIEESYAVAEQASIPTTDTKLVSELKESAEVRRAKESWQAERTKLMTQLDVATKALKRCVHILDHWPVHCFDCSSNDCSNPTPGLLDDAKLTAIEALEEIERLG